VAYLSYYSELQRGQLNKAITSEQTSTQAQICCTPEEGQYQFVCSVWIDKLSGTMMPNWVALILVWVKQKIVPCYCFEVVRPRPCRMLPLTGPLLICQTIYE
jgi:hypothetical protein